MILDVHYGFLHLATYGYFNLFKNKEPGDWFATLNKFLRIVKSFMAYD